jgi:hypothetical protein
MDFTRGTLDPRVTFSRVSNATYYDSTGKLTYAPNNLFTWSQDFTNAVWSKTRSTISASTFVAPDGTSTAQKLIPNAGVTDADIRPFTTTTTVTGRTEIYSIYAKAAEYNGIAISDFFLGNSLSYFNLNTGVATAGSAVSAGMTAVGNGWYRCWIVLTPTGTSGYSFFRVAQNGSVTLPAANGTDGVLMWGAQREVVTYQTTPSTYNPTTSAAYYGPRFDYDPATLAARGLLIEEARTNLVPTSVPASANSGTGTFAANAAISPDGRQNAPSFTATTASPYGNQSSITVVASTNSYAYSVFVKRLSGTGQADFLAGRVGGFSSGTFNFDTETFSGIAGTFQKLGNGWYRLIFVQANNGSDTTLLLRAGALGLNTSISAWGYQIELGAFATSHIPTVASTGGLNRSADTAYMDGTNFSSWYNQSAGTFILNGAIVGYPASGAPYSLGVDDGTASNFIGIIGVSGGFTANSSGLASTLPLGNPVPATLNFSVSLGLAANDVAGCINGGTVQTRNVYTPPTNLSALRLGNITAAGGFASNLWVRSLTYYRTRLPNDTLQVLTQ